MNVNQLQTTVHSHLTENADALGIDASGLKITYVLNWGGFVNHSFRVSDGSARYHLKLGTTDEQRSTLRRWYELNETLQRYHAPPVLDWLEFDGVCGLLFPVVSGSTPELDDEVLDAVTSAIRPLWQDGELAATLRSAGTITAADTYFGIYDTRFTEDLASMREERPPFVSLDTIAYLEDQVALLAERVKSNEAFAEELDSPVHGDLWLNNVLWKSRDSWYLLDWDDVRIGDPAIDVAMLTGPTAIDLTPLKRLDEMWPRLTAVQRERLTLLGRASLLDWVIDPVSDWIVAGVAPDLRDVVRAEKEGTHHSALALYRRLFD